MQLLLTFTFWIILGVLTSFYARERGRQPWSWFFVGLFLGLLGLLLLFILPKKISDKRGTTPLKSKLEPIEVRQQPSYVNKLWYYLDQQNKQYGPMSFEALNNAWKEGIITSHTYVWNEELDNWKTLDQFLGSPSLESN
jgi:hypothetical protein